jgi:outer membrane protein assembly factor BamB
MRRSLSIVLMTAALLAGGAAPMAIADTPYPDVIPLPNGFFPEGIAVGNGHTYYTGSLADGAIWTGDLRTGEGSVLVPGTPGRLAVGMDFDNSSGNLFVAGGPGGTLSVYDTSDGSTVAEVALPGAFLNDVIVSGRTAYVTDSFLPQFFAVDLDNRGTPTGSYATLPLGGDFGFVPGQFNANGIEATQDGSALIIVNAFLGELYRVDPASGDASLIDLGGSVVNGDGLVLAGRTLYAVEGGKNQITEIRLAPDLSSGQVTEAITSPAFDVPTTAARFGNSLYAVNARFSTPPLPTTEYQVVRVTR